MRILGIDPGSLATGYGLVERCDGQIHHLGHGVIRSPRGTPLPERLARLHRELTRLIERERPESAAVERVFVFAREQGLEYSWGKGQTGSLNVSVPDICHRSLFSVFTNGKITWNFGWFRDDDRQRAFRDEVAERLVSEFGAEFPPNVDERWPTMRAEKWASRVDALLAVLTAAIEEHRKPVPEAPTAS